MKYFFKVDMTYVPKNKLHNELQDFIRNLDNTLLDTNDCKNTFLRDIREKILELQQQHYRCKKVDLQTYTGIDCQNLILTVSGNFTATIFWAKHIRTNKPLEELLEPVGETYEAIKDILYGNFEMNNPAGDQIMEKIGELRGSAAEAIQRNCMP